MAMAKLDPEILAHLEWLGFVRPTGLVVSAPALVRAGAILDRRDAEGQRLLRACVEERTFDPKEGPVPYLPDFRAFAESVLGWSFSPKGYAGTAESPIPPELEVPLPDYGETLRPDFAVRELEPKDGASPWQLLVRVLEPGEDFDRVVRGARPARGLGSRPHGAAAAPDRRAGGPALQRPRAAPRLRAARRELGLARLPRRGHGPDRGPADLDRAAPAPRPAAAPQPAARAAPRRAPRGQPQVPERGQRAPGRAGAARALRAAARLPGRARRLEGRAAAPAARRASRRGLPRAPHRHPAARLPALRRGAGHAARGRDVPALLLARRASTSACARTPRSSRTRWTSATAPGRSSSSSSAWSTTAPSAGAMRLPKRHGVLFDPDRFTFLEGRPTGGARQIHERIEPPLVPDGTIYRALEKLLVLDGERISYRALDVEQIGSVYETMMGFRLETATGRSVAIKAQKKQGAPTAVDLEALLARAGGQARRSGSRTAPTGSSPTRSRRPSTAAATLEDLHAALLPVIDPAATPDLVPKGAMVLQPSEERRRSGSHYTPRALTEPIVRTTLEPILARLRGATDGRPDPDADPRPQGLRPGDGLGRVPGRGLPPARRRAGRGLARPRRGARDPARRGRGDLRAPAHRAALPLRRGPEPRGGGPRQGVALARDAGEGPRAHLRGPRAPARRLAGRALAEADRGVPLGSDAPRFQAASRRSACASTWRRSPSCGAQIREADEASRTGSCATCGTRRSSSSARCGSSAISCSRPSSRARSRRSARRSAASTRARWSSGEAERYRGWLEEWRHAEPPLAPFHWEIEFPEVFDREESRLRCDRRKPAVSWVERTISHHTWATSTRTGYLLLTRELTATPTSSPTSSGARLITLSQRRHLRPDRHEHDRPGRHAVDRPALDLHARRRDLSTRQTRFKWPGLAAVVVSVVHVSKGASYRPHALLDGRAVGQITAFLFHRGGTTTPRLSRQTPARASMGRNVYGRASPSTTAITIGYPARRDAASLSQATHGMQSVIFPYIGGEEVNTQPTHASPPLRDQLSAT